MMEKNGRRQKLVRDATRYVARGQVMKGFTGCKKFEHYLVGDKELSWVFTKAMKTLFMCYRYIFLSAM